MRSRGARVAAALKERVPGSTRQTMKIVRARAFERTGSQRFSHPALYDLDRRLLLYLPRIPGVFLEIGANNGYAQSNTYYLERALGWRGVLIEPLPALYLTCRKLRRKSQCFNVACVAPADEGQSVEMVDLGLVSVTLGQQDPRLEVERLAGSRLSGKAVRVPSATLSAVIEKSGEASIDFMSVDVEGAELQVLAGLDLNRHTPAWMLIETDQLDKVLELVGPTMDLVCQMTHHDYLLKRR